MQHANAKKATIYYKLIGEIFLEERIRQKKSLRILADEFDIQRSMVSRMERGVNEPKLCSILSLCEALGITPQELFRRVAERLPKDFTLMDL